MGFQQHLRAGVLLGFSTEDRGRGTAVPCAPPGAAVLSLQAPGDCLHQVCAGQPAGAASPPGWPRLGTPILAVSPSELLLWCGLGLVPDATGTRLFQTPGSCWPHDCSVLTGPGRFGSCCKGAVTSLQPPAALGRSCHLAACPQRLGLLGKGSPACLCPLLLEVKQLGSYSCHVCV